MKDRYCGACAEELRYLGFELGDSQSPGRRTKTDLEMLVSLVRATGSGGYGGQLDPGSVAHQCVRRDGNRQAIATLLWRSPRARR